MRQISMLGLAAAVILMAACSQDEATSAVSAMVETSASAAESASKMAADGAAKAVNFGDAPGGRYIADKTHAYITFSYLHKGYSNPYLRFRSFETELDFDQENPANSQLRVDIDVNSIDSGVDIFDEHLRGEKWFNVAAHPRAQFVSTSYNPTTGKLVGDLTLKGITKSVTLDSTINKVGQGRNGGAIIGTSARAKILRSDWDLGAYVPVVGDDINLIIEVEFNQAK